MVIAAGITLVGSFALTVGAIVVAGPFLPATWWLRITVFLPLGLLVGLAMNLLAERLWGRLRLPARGPQDFLPLRWINQRRATFQVRKLVNELASSTPPKDAVEALTHLSHALERRDLYTRVHSGRVGRLTMQVLEYLGVSPEQCETGRVAGLLHDVGKIGIPDSILFKAGPLSPSEVEIMNEHPVIGADLVGPYAERDVLDAVRHHHERMDGNGYPDGVPAPTLGIVSRAIPVCDTYDSLISDRPYRRAKTKEEAFHELRAAAGAQLDPLLVEVLIEVEQSKMRLIGPLVAFPLLVAASLSRKVVHAIRSSAAPTATGAAIAAASLGVLFGMGGKQAPDVVQPSAVPSQEAQQQTPGDQPTHFPTAVATGSASTKMLAFGSSTPPVAVAMESRPQPDLPTDCRLLSTGPELPRLPLIGCPADLIPKP
jgi:hypothetical protein